jgi:hypothetical protein
MTENKKLEVGEKYLSIILLGSIRLVAFPNKEKKTENSADFVGSGIQIWVNRKKAEAEKPKEELI